MITRNALKKFDETYPELRYYPDHVRTAHFDGSRDIGMYFQALIDPEFKKISFRRLHVLSVYEKSWNHYLLLSMDKIKSYW